MKGFLTTTSMAAAAFAFVAPASAATQISATASGTSGSTPGHTILCDFETNAQCAGGFTSGEPNSVFGRFSADVNNTAVMRNGTGFFAVERGIAVLTLADLGWRQFSFDWGSVDKYNSVIFTLANGFSKTFTANDIFGASLPANTTVQRVAFSASDVISSVGFKSTQRSMEFDNIGGAVPEPGTWLLMILGLGAVGFAMRRRQKTAVRFQFA